MSSGSSRAIVVALIVNLAIAALKFVAAFASHSSATMAEAAHSVADCANQVFLLVGLHLAGRPPDRRHPFGYGREQFFWAFLVAMSLFVVGATFSVYEGVVKVLHAGDPRHALGDPRWAIGVLGVSIVLEAFSLRVAIAALRQALGGRRVREVLRETRDTSLLTVLCEDSAALLGLLVALAGVILAVATGNPLWDGVASILVGLALAAVAVFLGTLSKAMLIGMGVPPAAHARILAAAAGSPDVERVVHARTVHLAPEEVLVAMKVHFVDGLDTDGVERAIDDLERRVRAELPHQARIYVEAGRPRTRRHEVA